MWVIRAGQNALYYDKFINDSKVYLPWDGYKMDLSKIETLADFRKVVEKEKQTDNCTSISNWASQLYAFTKLVKKGDSVLIPSKGSHTYCLAEIAGEYFFNRNDKDGLYHSREIVIKETGIPRELFPQAIVYSLGAFRTIFQAKDEEEIMKVIKRWKEEKR